jgi:hypothetical protein
VVVVVIFVANMALVLSKVDISVAVVSPGTSDVVIVVTFDVNVASVLSIVDISEAVVDGKCYYNHHIRCSWCNNSDRYIDFG